MTTAEKLKSAYKQNHSCLCLGIDDTNQYSWRGLERFVTDTVDLVCAYKLNLAYYLALGDGLATLGYLVRTIKIKSDNTVPIILDAKFGDIPDTSEYYARFVYDDLDVDAVTLTPWIGSDGLAPFFARKDKLNFILLRSSNNFSFELQTFSNDKNELAWEEALYCNTPIKQYEQAGLVVAAAHTTEMKSLREYCNLPVLIPGVGAQGGDYKTVIESIRDNYLINVTRSIHNYSLFGLDSVREAALHYKNAFNEVERSLRK